METKLKQRMIGAIVLTMIAIIILPMLLDGSAEDRARVIATAPEPPRIEVDSFTIEQIQQKMSANDLANVQDLPVYRADAVEQIENSGNLTSDNQTAIKTASKDYALDQNSLPVGWTLQLGSFRNQQNAMKLRQDLRDDKYNSYILTDKGEQAVMYKVFVGPMHNRSELSAYGEKIEKDFDLKGRVIRYNIEDDANQLGG
ncbi:MAG: SPOR domain-containing protein [Pseudomonadales bacterium]|nr:SPOR domain-containing protein [Pseudomonadales bacterium]